MKKILFTLLLINSISLVFGQADNLNGVTFGFGAGYSGSFDKTYDYTLTTDASHSLKIQPLNKGAFVISSVVMVKLGKIGLDQNTNNFVRQDGKPEVGFWRHLSVNLALNMINISQDVSFNKNVDGGLGIGYFLSENLQAALFYDVSRVSQLRDYIVTAYQDKPIPNGDGTNYNALDPKDTNLFYNKTISGLSFKLVFSLANKKAPQTPPAK